MTIFQFSRSGLILWIPQEQRHELVAQSADRWRHKPCRWRCFCRWHPWDAVFGTSARHAGSGSENGVLSTQKKNTISLPIHVFFLDVWNMILRGFHNQLGVNLTGILSRRNLKICIPMGTVHSWISTYSITGRQNENKAKGITMVVSCVLW